MNKTICVCCLRNDLPVAAEEDCVRCILCAPCAVYQEAGADEADTPEHMARHNLYVDPERYRLWGTIDTGSAS